MNVTGYDAEEAIAEVGVETIATARQLFEKLGFADDFAIQTGRTFGSTNRVTLTPIGWVIDTALCTEAFIAACRNYGVVISH